jgi:hypothetical protein
VPVNILYCEGSPQGLDIRIISQLAPKNCLVKAIGGKTSNFMESILADRAINPNLAGLVDRDFDCDPPAVCQQSLPYFHKNSQVGWSWERKEIENYLLDPTVVQQALGNKRFTAADYQSALDRAIEKLRIYTAARTALTCYSFKNFWGDSVQDFAADYRIPSDLSQATCTTKIEEIVRQSSKERIVQPADVLAKFQQLLPEFRTGGDRLNHPLIFFSGKDILYMMRQELIDWDFDAKQPIKAFQELIINRMERADNVWEWLPEWNHLRTLLHQENFSQN